MKKPCELDNSMEKSKETVSVSYIEIRRNILYLVLLFCMMCLVLYDNCLSALVACCQSIPVSHSLSRVSCSCKKQEDSIVEAMIYFF